MVLCESLSSFGRAKEEGEGEEVKAKWIYCRFCGAKLKRDSVGQYCPTRNCQWQYGLPEADDLLTKKVKK